MIQLVSMVIKIPLLKRKAALTFCPLISQVRLRGGSEIAVVQFASRRSPGEYQLFAVCTVGPAGGRSVTELFI